MVTCSTGLYLNGVGARVRRPFSVSNCQVSVAQRLFSFGQGCIFRSKYSCENIVRYLVAQLLVRLVMLVHCIKKQLQLFIFFFFKKNTTFAAIAFQRGKIHFSGEIIPRETRLPINAGKFKNSLFSSGVSHSGLNLCRTENYV